MVAFSLWAVKHRVAWGGRLFFGTRWCPVGLAKSSPDDGLSVASAKESKTYGVVVIALRSLAGAPRCEYCCEHECYHYYRSALAMIVVVVGVILHRAWSVPTI